MPICYIPDLPPEIPSIEPVILEKLRARHEDGIEIVAVIIEPGTYPEGLIH